MEFDEDFHLGIIKLYAHQWSPFFAHQPQGGDVFGALTADPSYLYHYLMSFPYRITNSLFHNEFYNILMLRLLSVGFVVSGMIIFRKVLAYTKASHAMINAVFLFFVLTPLVPMVAAQINYDNLLMPLTGLSLLLTLRFMDELRMKHRIHLTLLASIMSVALLASLVQFAYLPILTMLTLYIAAVLFYPIRGLALNRAMWRDAWQRLKQTRRWVAIAIFSLLFVSVGLFSAAYGRNVITYHTPVPACDHVLSAQRCNSYGVWARNEGYIQSRLPANQNPIEHMITWSHNYLYSFFDVVNGESSGFVLAPALPVIYWAAVAFFIVGLAFLVIYGKRIFGNSSVLFLGVIIGFYTLTLWHHNYSDYLAYGRHIAEQGRYFFILLLPLYAMFSLGFRYALAHRPDLKMGFLLAVLFLFLQGGGLITYIVRTDSTWWWQNNSLSTNLNQTAKKILRPLIITG